MQSLTDYLQYINFDSDFITELTIAFLVFGVAFLILSYIKRSILNKYKIDARKDLEHFSEWLSALAKATSLFTLLVVSLSFALFFVTLSESGERRFGQLLMLTLIVQVGFWLSVIVGESLNRAYKHKAARDPSGATALGLMSLLARVSIWVIAVLLILDNLGINITALVAGLGIGGVAIALAVQNILGDLMASLSIVFDKPFAVGDFIVVGDFRGTIEKIGIKTTRVRSLDGEQVVFSNSDLLNSRIRNFKQLYERRVLFSVGVTYQTPLEKLKEIPARFEELVKRQEKTRFDRSHLKEFGDSSINFEVVYFVLASEYAVFMDIQQKINLEIYEYFAANNIEFAYPTRTVHLYNANT